MGSMEFGAVHVGCLPFGCVVNGVPSGRRCWESPIRRPGVPARRHHRPPLCPVTGITILLSLIVFSLVAHDVLPTNSDRLPLIGILHLNTSPKVELVALLPRPGRAESTAQPDLR